MNDRQKAIDALLDARESVALAKESARQIALSHLHEAFYLVANLELELDAMREDVNAIIDRLRVEVL